MAPVFTSGDFIIIRHTTQTHCYTAGDYILFSHPRYGTVIKRVVTQDQTLAYQVSGENCLSTTSHAFGCIPPNWIIGHAIFHIPKTGLPKTISCPPEQRSKIF